MTDRITEIETQLEALQVELNKRKEYQELLKEKRNPNLQEFLEIANKFVSQFEGEIPLKLGTVDNIKIHYWCGKWNVSFNMHPTVIGGTVYDIHSFEDINSRIEEHIKSTRDRLLNDRARCLSEMEDEIMKIDERLKELEENVEKLKKGK